MKHPYAIDRITPPKRHTMDPLDFFETLYDCVLLRQDAQGGREGGEGGGGGGGGFAGDGARPKSQTGILEISPMRAPADIKLQALADEGGEGWVDGREGAGLGVRVQPEPGSLHARLHQLSHPMNRSSRDETTSSAISCRRSGQSDPTA